MSPLMPSGVPWGASYDPWILPPLRTFGVGAFTVDGAWHNLDLTPMVGGGVCAIVLLVRVNATAAGRQVAFRGPNDGADALVCVAQVANLDNYSPGVIGTDGLTYIRYNASAAGGFTDITVRLLGRHLSNR